MKLLITLMLLLENNRLEYVNENAIILDPNKDLLNKVKR